MSPPPMSKSNLHPWENGSWLMIKSSLVRPHLGQSGCHLKSLEALLDGMKYVEIFWTENLLTRLPALRRILVHSGKPNLLHCACMLCYVAHLLLVYFIWTNFKGRLTGKLYIFPYYWRGICSFVVREIIIYFFCNWKGFCLPYFFIVKALMRPCVSQ